MLCNICKQKLDDEPLFSSGSDRALTSLCEVRQGTTRVWQCPSCSHLRGEVLEDNDAYYDSDYRILIDEEEEDQIYEVRGEQIVYRTEHQAETLLKKLDPEEGASLLDYGCAKAATPRLLLKKGYNLDVHVFDVSSMYKPFWDRFIAKDRQATYETPPHWQQKFDIVTSFFALEHIPTPEKTARHVFELLKPDGVFYAIVPDTLSNPADFIVIDHVNHFTTASLDRLLRRAGFTDIDIDDGVHRGALVVMARKEGEASEAPAVAPLLQKSVALADYWKSLDKYLLQAEQQAGDGPAAIYGSGFYGTWIASILDNPDNIRCFLDQSPFQQGRKLLDKPILAPEQLPREVQVLYIGLNPAIARASVAEMDWLKDRDLQIIYLEQE